MGNLKYWVFVGTLFISACGTTQTQIPVVPSVTVSATETPILPTSTPDYIVVIMTATPGPPKPFLAQECFTTAITQMDLNSCAVQEFELSKTELEKTVSEIKFSPEENQKFDQLQKEWQILIEKDCEFLYGQLYTADNGALLYKRGSMAPMLRGLCLAERYKQRTEDLKFAYFEQ